MKKAKHAGMTYSTVLKEVKTINLEELLQFSFYLIVQFPQVPLLWKPRFHHH